jgi:hypothetical protein
MRGNSVDMPKKKMTKSEQATLSLVKREMNLPRVAMSARKALSALANLEKLVVEHDS